VADTFLSDYGRIARLWIRASLTYRASFAIMTASSFFLTFLDFVAIGLMFHVIDRLGGFELWEVALLYGASGIGIGVADILIGSVELIGQHIRTGTLDAMLVRPVPLLVQVCADRFALRRLGRITQTLIVFAYGASHVDWTVPKVGVAVLMAVGAVAIFFSLFVGVSCLQFWTSDSTEVANAFTYGGNTMTQYPLTIFPVEVAKSLTYLFPIAFTNWYSCLYLLDRTDPFGAPAWFALLPLPVGAVMVALALTVWRAGVRTYTSTGS
jgi:ABC-2 type transport system permease protein